MSYIGILVMGLYSILWSLRGSLILSLTDGIGSLLLLLNLIALRHSVKYERNIYFGLGTLSILLIIIFWNGSLVEATYLWFFLYPAIASFLLGSRRGGIAASLIMIPVVVSVGQWHYTGGSEGYTAFFGIRLILSYAVVAYLTFLFERAAEKSRKEINALNRSLEEKVERRTQELMEKNNMLAHEVADRIAPEHRIALSLKEKEVLLKEVHHRTKNNMNVIISLLNLQKWHVTPDNIEETFELLGNRIRSMSVVHERLYQSENVATLDLGDYILDLAKQLRASFAQDEREIEIIHESDEVMIGLDQAVPLGLALNEILTNAFKHGKIEGTPLKLSSSVKMDSEGLIQVIVSDNGPGFPGDFDLESSKTLGTHLIYILLNDQLDANVAVESSAGTRYTIAFSLLDS